MWRLALWPAVLSAMLTGATIPALGVSAASYAGCRETRRARYHAWLRAVGSVHPSAVVDDGNARGFHHEFVDVTVGRRGDESLPVNLGEIPDYYRRFLDPVDVACIRAAPMDAEGWFNFGATNAHLQAITERARIVIVPGVIRSGSD